MQPPKEIDKTWKKIYPPFKEIEACPFLIWLLYTLLVKISYITPSYKCLCYFNTVQVVLNQM
jgi:uncharacterized protein with PQ loop repeat